MSLSSTMRGAIAGAATVVALAPPMAEVDFLLVLVWTLQSGISQTHEGTAASQHHLSRNNLRSWLQGLSVGGARCCWIQEPNGRQLGSPGSGAGLVHLVDFGGTV
jgi:hypothetical protein